MSWCKIKSKKINYKRLFTLECIKKIKILFNKIAGYVCLNFGSDFLFYSNDSSHGKLIKQVSLKTL